MPGPWYLLLNIPVRLLLLFKGSLINRESPESFQCRAKGLGGGVRGFEAGRRAYVRGLGLHARISLLIQVALTRL